MAETVVLMVRWDREGLPEVLVVAPDNVPASDVVHALALAQVRIAKQLTQGLAEAVSETAHFRALLDAERAGEGNAPAAEPADPA